MKETVLVRYFNSNVGVKVVGIRDIFVIIAIVGFCKLVELRDYNKVVCSIELLNKVTENYFKYYGTDVSNCELAYLDCKRDLNCEILEDGIKFSGEEGWFINPRGIIFFSDICKINKSQPKEMQFSEDYLSKQFDLFLIEDY